jgi:hypothetical protein
MRRIARAKGMTLNLTFYATHPISWVPRPVSAYHPAAAAAGSPKESNREHPRIVAEALGRVVKPAERYAPDANH